MCRVPLEGCDELEQSQEIKLAARCLAVHRPSKVWGSSGLSERDSQCQNTLGGLKHQASGREFKLEIPPDHY